MSRLKKLIIITGPTASGKTDAAIKLAKSMQGKIVSADSRQLYIGMNIGTATPSLDTGTYNQPHNALKPDTVNGIDHFLFNISTPDHPINLPRWQTKALTVIDNLHRRGYQPLLVGGTMLYIDSIVKNYTIPTIESNDKLRSQLRKEDTEKLYIELLKLDPAIKEFIEPHNKQRIIRALEVIHTTGKPFSQQRHDNPPPYHIEMLGIFPGWEQITDNISKRNKTMLQKGLIEETQTLLKSYGPNLPLLKTLNYKQALDVITGRLTIKEASHEMDRKNLRYARRQMSWWKNRREIEWFKTTTDLLTHKINQ